MPGRHPNANANQRGRRTRQPRIDYSPSPAALVAIEARRSRYYPTNNYSGILNAIVCEWAALTGIELSSPPKSTAQTPCPDNSNSSARARLTSGAATQIATAWPEFQHHSRAHTPARVTSAPENRTEQARAICGARRRRDGQPCRALSVQGKLRCRWHGGCSTGPRTEGGRARALANLRQFSRGLNRCCPDPASKMGQPAKIAPQSQLPDASLTADS